MPISAERTINGSFGQLFNGSDWMANVTSVEATMTIDKRGVKIPGTRETGYKATNATGEGTISQMKITSTWLRTLSFYMRQPRSKQPTFTLRYRLDDPEAFGAEEIELTYVKMWSINMGYQTDTLVEERIPFTFQNFRIISAIDGTIDEYQGGGQDYT